MYSYVSSAPSQVAASTSLPPSSRSSTIITAQTPLIISQIFSSSPRVHYTTTPIVIRKGSLSPPGKVQQTPIQLLNEPFSVPKAYQMVASQKPMIQQQEQAKQLSQIQQLSPRTPLSSTQPSTARHNNFYPSPDLKIPPQPLTSRDFSPPANRPMINNNSRHISPLQQNENKLFQTQPSSPPRIPTQFLKQDYLQFQHTYTSNNNDSQSVNEQEAKIPVKQIKWTKAAMPQDQTHSSRVQNDKLHSIVLSESDTNSLSHSLHNMTPTPMTLMFLENESYKPTEQIINLPTVEQLPPPHLLMKPLALGQIVLQQQSQDQEPVKLSDRKRDAVVSFDWKINSDQQMFNAAVATSTAQSPQHLKNSSLITAHFIDNAMRSSQYSMRQNSMFGSTFDSTAISPIGSPQNKEFAIEPLYPYVEILADSTEEFIGSSEQIIQQQQRQIDEACTQLRKMQAIRGVDRIDESNPLNSCEYSFKKSEKNQQPTLSILSEAIKRVSADGLRKSKSGSKNSSIQGRPEIINAYPLGADFIAEESQRGHPLETPSKNGIVADGRSSLEVSGIKTSAPKPLVFKTPINKVAHFPCGFIPK